MRKTPTLDSQKEISDRSPIGVISQIAISTTLRLFVPTVGLTVLGLWLDRNFGMMPLFTAVGIVIGSILAGLLIIRQLNQD